MPTTEFVSSTDPGTQTLVSEYIKDPTLVQSVMTKLLDKRFIADALLRAAPGAPGGVVKFHEDEPQFVNGVEIVAEYGEIPVVTGGHGTPRAVFTRKAGGALLISREMQTRNDVDAINKRLRQIRNTFVQFWDDLFMQAIMQNATVVDNARAVPAAWTTPSALVRTDLSKAKESILERTDENGNEFGFNPDTLVLHPARAEALTTNDDVAKIFRGNIADRAPLFKGDLGRDISNLVILTSFRVPRTTALVLERKTIGFISDEYPQETTPLYEIRERQTHRSDTTRSSAVGIDAPKAIQMLTGI